MDIKQNSFEEGGILSFWWPNCAVKSCVNKCCRRLKSKYCWAHTPGINPKEVVENLEAEHSFCSFIKEKDE